MKITYIVNRPLGSEYGLIPGCSENLYLGVLRDGPGKSFPVKTRMLSTFKSPPDL